VDSTSSRSRYIFKHSNKHAHTQQNGTHRCILSDGAHFQEGVLGPKLREKIEKNELVKGCVVELLEYSCTWFPDESNKKYLLIIVKNAEIKSKALARLGNPTTYYLKKRDGNATAPEKSGPVQYQQQQPKLPPGNTNHKAQHQCTNCKATLKKVLRCPCRNAVYCGRKCQKRDWPKHKVMFHSKNKKSEEKKKTESKTIVISDEAKSNVEDMCLLYESGRRQKHPFNCECCGSNREFDMIAAAYIGQEIALQNVVATYNLLDFFKSCMKIRPKGEEYRFLSCKGGVVNWSTPITPDTMELGRGNFDVELSSKNQVLFTSEAKDRAISRFRHRFRTAVLRVYFTNKKKSTRARRDVSPVVSRVWSFMVVDQEDARIPKIQVIGASENAAAFTLDKKGKPNKDIPSSLTSIYM